MATQNEACFEFQKQWVRGILDPEPKTCTAARLELVQQGWGELCAGTSILHKPICLKGQVFDHGLGSHADSEIRVHLPGPGRRFTALAGLDDNPDTHNFCKTSVVFSVEIKGRTVWSSPALRIDSAPAKADVELGGATEFTLRIQAPDHEIGRAHADWAEPKVILADGSALWLGGPSRNDLSCPSFQPLSFIYGGKRSADIIPAWSVKKEIPRAVADRVIHRIVRRDPATGLECALELTEFQDFPALEWVARFTNTGTKDTPILENIQALDMAWAAFDEPVLYRSRGSLCKINDFEYRREPVLSNSTIRMVAGGGRSSNDWLPFFNLQSGAGGFFAAVGWSGQWAAEFSRGADNTVNLHAGMELTHLKLHPGETIRTPRMLLLFWSGELVAAHNLLRRFMLKHHVPQADGQPVQCPISMATWGGEDTQNHLDMIKEIVARRLPYEVYWVDAGWYGPADSYSPDVFAGGWAEHVGNWTVNPRAHPRGLKPIGDAAHQAGMKFLLWVEPERVVQGTPISIAHPEWLLGSAHKGASLLFNLGLPEARGWLTDLVSDLIAQNGIDIYRQDFNMDSLPFWRTADAADRQGMTEIRHIEGLYAFWDELLRRHPGLMIDNCSSGGRRIDIETLSRSLPLWRSDVQCGFNFDPMAGQIQTTGLAHWVPLSTCGTFMTSGDTYDFRSAMSAGIVGECRILAQHRPGSEYDWEWHRKMLLDQKRARPFFYGDYYPLVPTTATSFDWCVYQMHRPDLAAGLVMVFRRADSPFSSAEIRIKAVEPGARYEIEDADTGAVQQMSGKVLLETGLDFTIGSRRGSRLVWYRKV